eukprot:SAG31_NODE_4103_length_3579_cov_2.836494_2_plen_121_part_00
MMRTRKSTATLATAKQIPACSANFRSYSNSVDLNPSLENFNNQAARADQTDTQFGPICAGPVCDRVHFNAIVTDQELAETYLPAFTKGCVAGGRSRSIMCSYNAVRFNHMLPSVSMFPFT